MIKIQINFRVNKRNMWHGSTWLTTKLTAQVITAEEVNYTFTKPGPGESSRLRKCSELKRRKEGVKLFVFWIKVSSGHMKAIRMEQKGQKIRLEAVRNGFGMSRQDF